MNWIVKQTTAPIVLPVSLKEMLASASVSSSFSTTLTADASPTDTSISVANASGLTVGQTITIGDEFGVITAIDSLDLTITPALPKAVSSGDAVTFSNENASLLATLQAAVSLVESYLNRALIAQTFTYQSDGFPVSKIPWWDGVKQISQQAFAAHSFIELPRPPLRSISSVKYYDLDNNLTLFASSNYFVDTLAEPGRIILNYSSSWPINVRAAAATEIIYVAGYGSDRADVPSAIREAIKLQANYMLNASPDAVVEERLLGEATIKFDSFDNKQASGFYSASLTPTVRSLISGFKVFYL